MKMILIFKIFITLILFIILNIYKIFNIFFFDSFKKQVKMINIKDLSLQQKIGQLFIIAVKGSELTNKTKKFIRDYKIGNFIIFSKNYQNLDQFSKLITVKVVHILIRREYYNKVSSRFIEEGQIRLVKI